MFYVSFCIVWQAVSLWVVCWAVETILSTETSYTIFGGAMIVFLLRCLVSYNMAGGFAVSFV